MSCKVSVLTVTYNHERYIAQAVESVMMQETDFEFEMVIGEDCSTDGTRSVLLELRDRYPNRIRLLLHEKNLGASHNAAAVLDASVGDYVLYLDGDDFFTCPTKLQKQADVLDANPSYTLCAHRFRQLHGEGTENEHYVVSSVQKPVFTLQDLLTKYQLHLSALLMRKSALAPLPAWFHDVGLGDIVMEFLCLQNGPGGFIDEVMSTYRIHSGGVWSLKESRVKIDLSLHAWSTMADHAEPHTKGIVNRTVAGLLVDKADELERKGDRSGARKCIREAMRRAPSIFLRSAGPPRMALRVGAPRLYRALQACKSRLLPARAESESQP